MGNYNSFVSFVFPPSYLCLTFVIFCGMLSISSLTDGGDTMANTKQTSKSVASKASKILRDGRYSKTSKSVAGSALSQTKKGK